MHSRHDTLPHSLHTHALTGTPLMRCTELGGSWAEPGALRDQLGGLGRRGEGCRGCAEERSQR